MPQVAPQTTNPIAIVALVMSLLWLGGVGSMLGVVLGNVAGTECRRTGRPGGGMATAAVIISMIGLVLTVLVVLH